MKKLTASLLTLCLALGLLTGCGAEKAPAAEETTTPTETAAPATNATAPVTEKIDPVVEEAAEAKAPKYVFLFIGDGMSYPQFQITADYLGALTDEDYFKAQPSLTSNGGATLDGPKPLNFMNFEAAGTSVTYDLNSFAPDSSSTATAIATGNKTYSGVVGMDYTAKTAYESIAEKVHAQLGMKVGLVTSVPLNHATPAAFYANQASRDSYYKIGVELMDSGFEYLAGGGLRKNKGGSAKDPTLMELAVEKGYKVTTTDAEAKAITAADGKVLLIDEHLNNKDAYFGDNAMSYAIDRTEDMMSLADYVAKGIEVLDNEKGFFMMCEGGKIDWGGHANDVATVIHEVMAFEKAVQVAVDFAKEHPDETLIVVTGDHETGGLSIGFAGTDYDTYLTLLENQKISLVKFDAEYVDSTYFVDETPFETVLEDIERLFGLTTEAGSSSKLKLTGYEMECLERAYNKSMGNSNGGLSSQESKELYGSHDALTVTITNILANKAGVNFSSFQHSGLPTAVLADGVGAEVFNGYYDNTDIYYKMAELLNVK